ncbi:general substrate transporter [Aureobasidium pullulans]|nr:general substrate transporter [Aureobasidium pullulans]
MHDSEEPASSRPTHRSVIMGKATVILSSAFLAIGGFLFGYDSGIIGGVISFPQFIEYFNDPNSTVTGGIVSTFQGGAVLGTIINMVIADRLGRKRTIAAGSIVSLIGCILQAAAVNMAMLMVGRFVAGAAVGMLTSTIPMYAAEISESKYRGALSGALQWFLSWGFFAAQWIGYGCQHVKGPFSWRFPLAFQCIPAVILVSGIWFLQESPRWLCEKDRWEEARAVLQKLHHDGTAETDQRIELEFREIRDVIEADRVNNSTSVSTIFTKASWRKRLLLGCGVQAFGPLSGINVINYYGPEIYKILGIDNSTSLMIIGISGSLSIVYCTIGLWALERFGRVKPLIISAAGLGAALVCNAAMSQHLNPSNGNMLRAMVAMNFVFSLFYTPLGIISWVYPAEIFPVEVRAFGNATTTFTNWTLNLIFAQFTPQALDSIGFRYFYVFFVFNIIAMLCYIFFYPETKGKTLEQMDELFGDQLVPHALEDPKGAAIAMEKNGIETHEEVVKY